MLLSHYLGISITQLHFETETHGKPMLKTPSAIPIQFNVSHTKGMALIALTLQHAVGIDVEWIDRNIHDGDIAKRYFSAREATYLTSLSQTERTPQFFRLWTGKEAYLKMKGEGITGGLAQCELTIDPHQSEVRLSQVNQHNESRPCSLFQIIAGEEHIGAVAISRSSTEISYWSWQDDYPG